MMRIGRWQGAAWRIGAVVAASAVGALMATPAAAQTRCLNLGMSDVTFGKEAATASAWAKLADFAAAKVRERGWRGVTRSRARFVKCELYLDLGPLGTEYRCLVRATYCPK